MTDDWRWTIAKGLGKKQIIRSVLNSSQPPTNSGWEIQDMNNSWNKEPSLHMEPFIPPDSIYINTSVNNLDVGDVLEDKSITGRYVENDSHYVRRGAPVLYLFRNSAGVWVLGPELEERSAFLYFVGGIAELAEGGGTWIMVSPESDNATVILSLIMLQIIVGIVVSS